jgi:hypothetical protein
MRSLTVSIGIWKAIAPMTPSPSRIGAAMKLAGASYEGAYGSKSLNVTVSRWPSASAASTALASPDEASGPLARDAPKSTS